MSAYLRVSVSGCYHSLIYSHISRQSTSYTAIIMNTLLFHEFVESCWWLDASTRSSCGHVWFHWTFDSRHLCCWFFIQNGFFRWWRMFFRWHRQLNVLLWNWTGLGSVLLLCGGIVAQLSENRWRLSCCSQMNPISSIHTLLFWCDMICSGRQ